MEGLKCMRNTDTSTDKAVDEDASGDSLQPTQPSLVFAANGSLGSDLSKGQESAHALFGSRCGSRPSFYLQSVDAIHIRLYSLSRLSFVSLIELLELLSEPQSAFATLSGPDSYSCQYDLASFTECAGLICCFPNSRSET